MILQYPDSTLLKPTKTVEDFTQEVLDADWKLRSALSREQAYGVAANQMGINLRMAVLHRSDGGVLTIVNPKIVDSDGTWTFNEGCLSLPGIFFNIKRPKRIVLEWIDLAGEHREMFDELEARIIQHEVDHLQGRLILSRVSKLERREAVRTLEKRS